MNLVSSVRLRFEEIRVRAANTITANYLIIGSVFLNPVRMLHISNSTDASLYLSLEGVTDNLVIFPNSFLLFDIGSNKSNQGGLMEISKGNGLYVRAVGALPTTGSIFVSTGYASQN